MTREKRAHRRVRPLLTEPPTMVARLWLDRLKLERVTDTTGSKVKTITGLASVGDFYFTFTLLSINLEAYQSWLHKYI